MLALKVIPSWNNLASVKQTDEIIFGSAFSKQFINAGITLFPINSIFNKSIIILKSKLHSSEIALMHSEAFVTICMSSSESNLMISGKPSNALIRFRVLAYN
jgi:hypothetical protein